jgi:hypothetical protein
VTARLAANRRRKALPDSGDGAGDRRRNNENWRTGGEKRLSDWKRLTL